jgi:hypothetical protein
VLRALGEGRTLASAFKAYRIVSATGAVAASTAADLALAWRPPGSAWSVLERLELRGERADPGFDDANALGVPAAGSSAQTTRRIVNDLALHWRSGPEGGAHRVEASLYHGAKYVRGRYADETYDGFIDVMGFDLRRDLGQRFDLGVAGSVQHAWTAGAWAWSGGPSLGVSPGAGWWISAGWNVAGYRDRDFDADRYTRAGPYVTLRFKFDRDTAAALLRPLGSRR